VALPIAYIVRICELVWIGFSIGIIAASTLSILQAVDTIALKRVVDSRVVALVDEKMAAFRVAEGIRWSEVRLIVDIAFCKHSGQKSLVLQLHLGSQSYKQRYPVKR
jgi:hypothetical protein